MAGAESSEAAKTRLLGVIVQATLEILSGDYVWQPMRNGQPPSTDAIACVRDASVWFEFTPR
jgi:hypothetical protein